MINRGSYKNKYRKDYKRKYSGSYIRYNRFKFQKHRYYKKSLSENNNFTTLIGLIIVIIGILMVFKNTMVYSGGGVSRGLISGTSCGVAFILLIIGAAIITYNKNNILGWLAAIVGLLWFFIGIIINFKMVFMPMNLLKTIILFGFIGVGAAITIKGIIKNVL